MADTLNKAKIQLRHVGSFNTETPPTSPASPATKLLLNHGKPNFTIQRSPKVQQNGEGNPLSPQVTNADNNDIVVKSTKFNGVFKPANISVAAKQPHQQSNGENEANKVVLRRIKVPEPPLKDGEDDGVPEFIRRQRRIQERLAKENVLDFENRRSGYFTHVLISPTSANRTSFAETMSSPAIVPSLEIPPPATATATTETAHSQLENVAEESAPETHVNNVVSNGQVEEEEVARAIQEVNNAVAGEDDDKVDDVESVAPAVEEQSEAPVAEAALALAAAAEAPEAAAAAAPAETENVGGTDSVAETESQLTNGAPEEVVHAVVAVATLEHTEHTEETEVEETSLEQNEETQAEEAQPQENGHVDATEATTVNGNQVTISHTNGLDKPHIPSPDPSGALGVNYEPKTVVSFSRDLSSEPNKYPDTVKTADGTPAANENGDKANDALQELAKLKFDIKADEGDVQVTSVLRTD